MATSQDRARQAGDNTGQPVKRIEEDHRTIRDHLDSVAAATTRTDLLAALVVLPKTLREHFEQEEHAEGLYADLLRRKPSVSSELDALRHDHQVILEDLDVLVGRLKGHIDTAEAGDEIAEPIVRGVMRCLEKLRTHERNESRMIGDIYYTDEGGFG
ncbi:MAG: hemerythrin domain-containing protein [Myxococcota bacterium]|jgi:hypothetical protein|nr:hemerythrin domain-containing protein [Myxococcota bacterium]